MLLAVETVIILSIQRSTAEQFCASSQKLCELVFLYTDPE